MTIKKIGYTHKEAEIEQLKQAGCEEVVLANEPNVTVNHFLKMAKQYQDSEIILVDFDSIVEDISIINMMKILEQVSGKLTVLDKFITSPISNQAYLEMIHFLGKKQKSIIAKRTRKGIGEARKEGRIGGRPAVSDETIHRITYLFHKKAKTYREIAAECEVSIGTVSKYIKQK